MVITQKSPTTPRANAQKVVAQASAPNLWKVVASIGGDEGYYFANPLLAHPADALPDRLPDPNTRFFITRLDEDGSVDYSAGCQGLPQTPVGAGNSLLRMCSTKALPLAILSAGSAGFIPENSS